MARLQTTISDAKMCHFRLHHLREI